MPYCKQCLKTIHGENRVLHWSRTTIQHHRRKFPVLFSAHELKKVIENHSACQFCGRQFCWENSKIQDDSPTVDRMDNGQNLTLSNILILCHQCNSTKRNRSLPEFLAYSEKIVQVVTHLLKQKTPMLAHEG
jgi:hypothetical protein